VDVSGLDVDLAVEPAVGAAVEVRTEGSSNKSIEKSEGNSEVTAGGIATLRS
jgi:hypothetical protein